MAADAPQQWAGRASGDRTFFDGDGHPEGELVALDDGVSHRELAILQSGRTLLHHVEVHEPFPGCDATIL